MEPEYVELLRRLEAGEPIGSSPRAERLRRLWRALEGEGAGAPPERLGVALRRAVLERFGSRQGSVAGAGSRAPEPFERLARLVHDSWRPSPEAALAAGLRAPRPSLRTLLYRVGGLGGHEWELDLAFTSHGSLSGQLVPVVEAGRDASEDWDGVPVELWPHRPGTGAPGHSTRVVGDSFWFGELPGEVFDLSIEGRRGAFVVPDLEPWVGEAEP